MASMNPFSETEVSPLAPIEQLAGWLLSATVECLLGALIGVLLARMLRRRHLHWSWAAVASVPVILLRSNVGAWADTLLGATRAATVCGRRWHREDAAAGSDLARLACERRAPIDMLGRSLRRAALRRRK